MLLPHIVNPLFPPSLKTIATSPREVKLIVQSSKNESWAGSFLDYTLIFWQELLLWWTCLPAREKQRVTVIPWDGSSSGWRVKVGRVELKGWICLTAHPINPVAEHTISSSSMQNGWGTGQGFGATAHTVLLGRASASQCDRGSALMQGQSGTCICLVLWDSMWAWVGCKDAGQQGWWCAASALWTYFNNRELSFMSSPLRRQVKCVRSTLSG